MRIRSLIVLAAAVVAVGAACSPTGTDPDDQSTTDADLDELIAVFDQDVAVIEWNSPLAIAGLPNTTTRIWSDGRYEMTFGSSLQRDREATLAGAVVAGRVGAGPLAGLLSLLLESDLDAEANAIESAECPEVIDGAPPSVTITGPGASRRLRPCDAWRIDEYPPLLAAATGLYIAARDDQPEVVSRYLHYDAGLLRVENGDWVVDALVVGTMVAVEQRSVEFDVEDVLVGVAEHETYTLVGTDRMRPTESTLR